MTYINFAGRQKFHSMKFRKFSWLIFSLSCLLILNLILLGYFYWREKEKRLSILQNQENNLKIIFFDVGQGDAILIRFPEGKNILIDGGPNQTIIYKLDQYIPFYQRKIDLMILTHPDPDHLNGLVEILKRYKVEKIFYNGVKDEGFSYHEFLKEIEAIEPLKFKSPALGWDIRIASKNYVGSILTYANKPIHINFFKKRI